MTQKCVYAKDFIYFFYAKDFNNSIVQLWMFHYLTYANFLTVFTCLFR